MNTDVPVAHALATRQDFFWTLVNQKVMTFTQNMLEQILLSEQQELIGAGWNERLTERAAWRNGFYRRQLTTPQGRLSVKVPRCRNATLDCSTIFNRYQRRVADVDRILRHAYLMGTSTRATAELAEQVFGGSLSHQTVSKLMRWLDEKLSLWRQQPVDACYKIVYVDGMHVDVLGQDQMVMIVAGQREHDGRLDVLGFCVSTGERCTELLADLRRRGLQGVEMFVSDQSASIRSALQQVYPEVTWQHCTFHRLQALRADVGPAKHRDLMLAEASCIFRCPSRQAASDAAKAWAIRWKPANAWAVQRFMDSLEDSLMFYQMPQTWWKRVRTNNPLERLIRTLRMRLRNMGCFHDTPAAQRAVFGQLARWHRLGTYTR